jgi:hypothetical protein
VPSFRAALATLPISQGGLFGLRQLFRSHLQGYYTTKIVVCQYAIRNFLYEKRNIFSFFVLLYYEKRDTIAKRKGVKACDQIQSQSDACPAGDDPKGTGRKDGYSSAYCVRNLRGNGEALARGCIGEDL